MRRVQLLLAAAGFIAIAAAATAAQAPRQQVTPPETRYWVGATTNAGLMGMAGGGGGVGAAMRMAMGGGQGYAQILEVASASANAPTGKGEANYTLPTGARFAPPLLLTKPDGRPQESPPGELNRPKGRILFFWGCGERAGQGQPAVLDFERIMQGDFPDMEMGGEVQTIRKPKPGDGRVYVNWPNPDDLRRNRSRAASVPAGATLAGEHLITSDFEKEIRFTLPADKTFMAPVNYTSTAKLPSGALGLEWSTVPRATGYALGIAGAGKDENELVLWSSAEKPGYFLIYSDLAPRVVERLIKEKVALAPATTRCAVPAQVLNALGQGGMLSFTAFGDQATFIEPARPADPSVTWDQQWFARVGFKSVRADMVSADGLMTMGAMMAGGAPAGAPPGEPPPACPPPRGSASGAVGEAIGAATGIPGAGALGRMIGGRRGQSQPEPARDPRCPQ